MAEAAMLEEDRGFRLRDDEESFGLAMSSSRGPDGVGMYVRII